MAARRGGYTRNEAISDGWCAPLKSRLMSSLSPCGMSAVGGAWGDGGTGERRHGSEKRRMVVVKLAGRGTAFTRKIQRVRSRELAKAHPVLRARRLVVGVLPSQANTSRRAPAFD